MDSDPEICKRLQFDPRILVEKIKQVHVYFNQTTVKSTSNCENAPPPLENAMPMETLCKEGNNDKFWVKNYGCVFMLNLCNGLVLL